MDRKCNSKTLCGSLAVIFCTFKQIGHHMTLSVMSRRGVDPVATVRGGNFKALTESRPEDLENCHHRLSVLNSSVTNRDVTER